jgi:hypothetical protein
VAVQRAQVAPCPTLHGAEPAPRSTGPGQRRPPPPQLVQVQELLEALVQFLQPFDENRVDLIECQ